jgi:hypothetical protein
MKLIEQVRAKLRLFHYAWDTEQSYVAWIERYIHFHNGSVSEFAPGSTTPTATLTGLL